VAEDRLFCPHHAHRLNDERRLIEQVSEAELTRLLALQGDEDVADLGSGTGFYTDRVAALTTGTVYAVELQAEMNELYRRRGVPANVQLVTGDVADLPLLPSSIDVACSIAAWHETRETLDLPGLLEILRPQGRLVLIDWRRDPESWGSGPPAELRSTKEEVARELSPFFAAVETENIGRFMFAAVARRGMARSTDRGRGQRPAPA
jgi:SAM-dependent methyltransferase